MDILSENNRLARMQGEQDRGAGLSFETERQRAFLESFHREITEKGLNAAFLEELRPVHETGVIPVAQQTQGRRERMEDHATFAVTSTRSPEEVIKFLENSFSLMSLSVDSIPRLRLDISVGSTTANVCYLSSDQERTLTVANAGDSRSILFIRDVDTGKVETQRLSYDHKASDPREQERVKAAGGRITDNDDGIRLNGETLCTRGFGYTGTPGYSNIPEMTQVSLGHHFKNPRQELFLLTCCDGLFELGVSEKDYARAMEAFLPAGKPSHEIASDLVVGCRLSVLFSNIAAVVGSEDNLTTIVTRLVPQQSKDVIIGLFDGSSGDQRLLGAEVSKKACMVLDEAAKPLKYRLAIPVRKTPVARSAAGSVPAP